MLTANSRSTKPLIPPHIQIVKLNLLPYEGGEECEWKTAPEKILRLGFLFFSLILVSTYTANLVAFFTEPAFELQGPRTYDELQNATLCAAFATDRGIPGEAVGNVIVPDDDENFLASLPPSGSGIDYTAREAYCHKAVVDGKVDGWFYQETLHQRVVSLGFPSIRNIIILRMCMHVVQSY